MSVPRALDVRVLERLSKTAALLSALLIVTLQIAFHPDGTATIRALAALALIAGWLIAQFSRQSIHALWLLAAPLAPAVLRVLTHREGPILDLIWMAGLTGTLLRTVSWSEWTFPAAWRVLIGGWALTLSLAWPVIAARELNFDPRLLRDAGTINSWALLSAPQVVGWTLHVALTQLLGLAWFDWVMGRLTTEPDRTPRAVHALWIGATIASLVAIYQGTVNIAFLSTPAWAALHRATGTMLDANAYGVIAAVAGPVAFVALRRSGWRHLLPFAIAVLLVDLVGMWLSGSRTALLCAVGGVAGLVVALSASRAPAVRRMVPLTAIAALVILGVLILVRPGSGPLARLLERPAASRGVVDSLLNRGGYGTIASRMVRDFPFTGVGLGAFHVIAPDYWRVMTDRQLPFDNAQNWWRHIAAEFGLLGALPVFIWSALVAWLVIAGSARPGQRTTAAVVRGLLAGLGACSLLGIPTQTPVVLLSFFLLVAWLAVLVRHADVQPIAARVRAGWIAVTVLAVAYAGAQLVLARGPLSVSARAIRAERDYVTGAYPLEGTPGAGQFRWTRGRAHFILRARTPWLVMRTWVNHPDIARFPVHITISTACGTLLDRTLTTNAPVSIGVELPPGERTFEGTVRVSRTWRPAAFGQPDPRELGAAVSTDFVADRQLIDQQNTGVHLSACGSGSPVTAAGTRR